MPRRPKEIMPTSEPRESSSLNIYGIWIVNKHDFPDGTWLLDGSGNIVHSYFIGVIRAQLKRLDGNAKVCIVNEEGNPEELE